MPPREQPAGDDQMVLLVSRVLRFGVALAAAITVIGLVLRAPGILHLGVVVLIATPVARVVFTFVAFVREKDHLYSAIALVVLALLGIGLFGPRL
jgi:uncharacterized membrane protein